MCTLSSMEIGTRELRANLAAALRQVGAGERLVDHRRRPPRRPARPARAEPAPPPSPTSPPSGLVEPPRRAQPAASPDPADTAVDVRLDRVLAEVRGG